MLIFPSPKPDNLEKNVKNVLLGNAQLTRMFFFWTIFVHLFELTSVLGWKISWINWPLWPFGTPGWKVTWYTMHKKRNLLKRISKCDDNTREIASSKVNVTDYRSWQILIFKFAEKTFFSCLFTSDKCFFQTHVRFTSGSYRETRT